MFYKSRALVKTDLPIYLVGGGEITTVRFSVLSLQTLDGIQAIIRVERHYKIAGTHADRKKRGEGRDLSLLESVVLRFN